jgi:hypothetical protein
MGEADEILKAREHGAGAANHYCISVHANAQSTRNCIRAALRNGTLNLPADFRMEPFSSSSVDVRIAKSNYRYR